MLGRPKSGNALKERSFELHIFPDGDSAHNLALEETLFFDYDRENGRELLLLYFNKSAVVFGKHQNPWTESNIPLLHNRGISVLRRFSGGGTVFHDRGNINWSFIGPRNGFSQEENLSVIAAAAAGFSGLAVGGFDISVRGDILYGGKKISGNALAFKGEKALHHGTLLVNSDLGELSQSLNGISKRCGVKISGIAVPSVSLPVTSLAAETKREDMQADLQGFGNALQVILSSAMVNLPQGKARLPSREIRLKYESSDWHFRRTPDFSVILETKPVIEVHKARARQVKTGRNWDLADYNSYLDFEDYIGSCGAKVDGMV